MTAPQPRVALLGELRDPPDLQARIAAAQARYDALSPIEKAVADLDSKRSGMIGLSKMSTPREVIEAQIDKMPEFVVLKAYRDASALIAELEREIAEAYRKNEEGTLHVLTCSADHRGPVGNDGCSCPTGRVIKNLRSSRAEEREACAKIADPEDAVCTCGECRGRRKVASAIRARATKEG